MIKYNSVREALNDLDKMTTASTVKLDGEAISPAEDWLLTIIHNLIQPQLSKQLSKEAERAIAVATALDLYPIPDWWLVRKRFLEDKSDLGRFSDVIVAVNEILEDALGLEKYVKGKFDKIFGPGR